ncbi:MAG: response regulator [Proteobacteria bacterium]|nr:response regulator [Pseudomonadota bacterium]
MPLKVYYLDDESDLCENFLDSFTSEDVEVATFTDPIKAVAHSQTNPPDLFFIDYRLPGTTGDQVARSLDGNIPMYLITGDITVNTEHQFKAVFKKPYKRAVVQAVIDSFLKMRVSA